MKGDHYCPILVKTNLCSWCSGFGNFCLVSRCLCGWALIQFWRLYDKCTTGVSGRAAHVVEANLVFIDELDMHGV